MAPIAQAGRESRENLALNAVRATAALLVVLGHARGYLLIPRDDASKDLMTQGLMALFSLGHGAVLVFFVLSGYFVGGSVLSGMRRGRFLWTSYTISRLTRLWLVLIPAIVLTAVLDFVGRSALGYSPQYGAGSNSENSDAWTVIGNVFFLNPVYVEPLGTNRALWSLTYEFAYYAVFPMLVAGIFFTKKLAVRAALILGGIAVLVFYGLAVAALFPAWLLGALIARYQNVLKGQLARVSGLTLAILRCLTIFALLAAMLWDKASGGTPWYTPPATYVVAVLAAVLVVLLLPDLSPRRLLPRKVLAFSSFLANSSYSLYATHLPVLVIVAVLFSPGGVTGSWEPSLIVWAQFFGVVAGLVLIGWIFSALTEAHTDTVRRFVTSKITKKRPASGAADSPRLRR